MSTVGVVLRTLDESELIGMCIETLRGQRGDFDLDIVVVDSGSTDATVEIARSHGCRIVELAPEEFDYSNALNVGIEQVQGELVVSLSAHAIPVDDGWLETAVAAFDDARVAGVSTRQVTWPDAPWQEVHRIQRVFGSVRRVYEASTSEALLFSNAASVIRREAWSQHRFTLPAVEDLDWARRVVTSGWKVVYEPATAVFHSHYETPREQARRMIDINRVHVPAGKQRTVLRTLREAAAYLRSDSMKILRLEEPLTRRLSYLGELVLIVWYYVVDFSSAGTTAERRRADSPS